MTSILYGWIPPRSTRKSKPRPFKPMIRDHNVGPIRQGANDFSTLPSIGTGIGNATVRKRVHYDNEEFVLREAKAQVLIAQKMKQVGPICNKGGLQYITNPEDWKTVGRKI